MPIVLDTKDWTWVLERRCPECGFDATTVPSDRVAELIRENAAAWQGVLSSWARLTEDNPAYPNWDQDATAVEDRYNEQDPSVVARELRDAAGALARSFEGVRDDAWSRTGTRSDRARFTVDTFARYMVHDPVHHLHDVTDGLGLQRLVPLHGRLCGYRGGDG